MEEIRLSELLAKKKSGEATPEEQKELNQYIHSIPDEEDILNQIDSLWNLPIDYKNSITKEQTDIKWKSSKNKIFDNVVEDNSLPIDSTKKVHFGNFPKIAIAASIIGLLVYVGFSLKTSNSQDQKQNVVTTKNGSKSKIDLPDGTQVWLNAGSKIIYDESYGNKVRELQLIGEAYFDVVHNAEKPFIIHTKQMNIKVLGTAFNVRAYQNDKTTEAALIRGSIEVSFPNRPNENLILKPNEKITILNNENVGPKNTANNNDDKSNVITLSKLNYEIKDSAVIETAWVKNKLIFKGQAFEQIAKDLERWFNVTIKIEDEYILTKKFTGTFNNETVEEALLALQLSYPFQYKYLKDKNLIIIESQSKP